MGLQESGETGQLWPPYPCAWRDGSAGRRDTGTFNCSSVNCRYLFAWFQLEAYLSYPCMSIQDSRQFSVRYVLKLIFKVFMNCPLIVLQLVQWYWENLVWGKQWESSNACGLSRGNRHCCTSKFLCFYPRVVLDLAPSVIWYWYRWSKVVTTVLLGCCVKAFCVFHWLFLLETDTNYMAMVDTGAAIPGPWLRTMDPNFARKSRQTVWIQISRGLDAQCWRIANHHSILCVWRTTFCTCASIIAMNIFYILIRSGL